MNIPKLIMNKVDVLFGMSGLLLLIIARAIAMAWQISTDRALQVYHYVGTYDGPIFREFLSADYNPIQVNMASGFLILNFIGHILIIAASAVITIRFLNNKT